VAFIPSLRYTVIKLPFASAEIKTRIIGVLEMRDEEDYRKLHRQQRRAVHDCRMHYNDDNRRQQQVIICQSLF